MTKFLLAGVIALSLLLGGSLAEAKSRGANAGKPVQTRGDGGKVCDPLAVDQCMDLCLSQGNRSGKGSPGRTCALKCEGRC